MQLISKWGCDGSSGHSEYMQKPHTLEENNNDECSNSGNENDHIENEKSENTFSDSNLFLLSFVPLRLDILMMLINQ